MRRDGRKHTRRRPQDRPCGLDRGFQDSPAENFRQEAAPAALANDAKGADVLVVLGDVTDDGRRARYEEAARLLRPWSGRLLLAPGNHDMGPQGILFQRNAARRSAARPNGAWMDRTMFKALQPPQRCLSR